MDPFEPLLRLLAVPLGAALAGWALALLPALRPPRRRDLVLGFALALGFAAALHVVDVRPGFPLGPSENAWSWVVWIALGAWLVGAVLVLTDLPEGASALVRFAAGTLAAWLVLHPLAPHALSPLRVLLEAGGWGAAAALLAGVLAHGSRHGHPVGLALQWLVALAATALLLTWSGRSMTMAAGAVALFGAVGASALVVSWRQAGTLPESASLPIAATFVGLLAGAHGYLNSGPDVRFGLPVALLLTGSAAACAIPRPRWAVVVSVALAAAAVGLGVPFEQNVFPD